MQLWAPVVEPVYVAARVLGCASLSSARLKLELHVGGERPVASGAKAEGSGSARDRAPVQASHAQAKPQPRRQQQPQQQSPWSAEGLEKMKAKVSKQLFKVREQVSDGLEKVKEQVTDQLEKVKEQVTDQLEKVKEQVTDHLEKVRLGLNAMSQSKVADHAQRAASCGVMVTLSLATLERLMGTVRGFKDALARPVDGDHHSAQVLGATGAGGGMDDAAVSGLVVELRVNNGPGGGGVRVAVRCGCGDEEQRFVPEQNQITIRCSCAKVSKRFFGFWYFMLACVKQ